MPIVRNEVSSGLKKTAESPSATDRYRLYFWNYRAVYLGPSPENALHRHHAAQLCIGLQRELRVRTGTDERWQHAPAFIIPPDKLHQVDAQGGRIMAIYWEPESDDCPLLESAVSAYHLATRADMDPADLRDRPIDAQWSYWARCLEFPDPPPFRVPQDSRVRRVIDSIRAHPHRAHAIEHLAATVSLSASRLRHLFVESVGVPIRQFLLWTRIRTVIHHVILGASLTDAAYAAGFSDAAHMTHTFRRTFGFAPSQLFRVRGRIGIGTGN